MKKILLVFTCILIFNACGFEEELDLTEKECGTHNGNILYVGPEGGCYYYNSNGNQTYVDRSECNCN